MQQTSAASLRSLSVNFAAFIGDARSAASGENLLQPVKPLAVRSPFPGAREMSYSSRGAGRWHPNDLAQAAQLRDVVSWDLCEPLRGAARATGS